MDIKNKMINTIKALFFIPCAPYFAFMMIYYTYLMLKNNDIPTLMNMQDDEHNDESDYIEEIDNKVRPFRYAFATIFWITIISNKLI